MIIVVIIIPVYTSAALHHNHHQPTHLDVGLERGKMTGVLVASPIAESTSSENKPPTPDRPSRFRCQSRLKMIISLFMFTLLTY